MTSPVITGSDSSPLRPSLTRTGWTTFLLAILFAACDLVRLGSQQTPLTQTTMLARYAGVAVSVTFLSLMRKGKYGRGLALTDICWLFFGAAIVLSALVHRDLEGAAIGLWSLSVVPLLFSRVIPCALGKNGVLVVTLATLGAGLPYLVFSVLVYPITFPYMGVLANPNGMGLLAGGMAIALIALLVAASRNGQRFFAVVLLITLLITIGLVLSSGSRTSCLAVSVAGLVGIASRLGSLVGTPLRLIRTAIILSLLAIMVRPIMIDSSVEAVAGIVMKFEKSSKLSERDEIWSKTLQDMSFLGNGRTYFEDEVGIGAHNSIIEMLGKYGIPAALGLLLISVSSLYSTFRYYRSARVTDAHALTPFLIALSFWILASGEMMVGPLGGAFNCCFLVAGGIANFLPGHAARCSVASSKVRNETQSCSQVIPCAS